MLKIALDNFDGELAQGVGTTPKGDVEAAIELVQKFCAWYSDEAIVSEVDASSEYDSLVVRRFALGRSVRSRGNGVASGVDPG